MTIDIKRLSEDDCAKWDTFVSDSPQGTIFHKKRFLDVIKKYSGGNLYLLVGYKTEEPRGIFPVFEQKKGPITLVFSPPPFLGIPYLGPALLNHQKMKQRKRELSNKRFIEGCLEWIEQNINPHYTRINTSWRYTDPRPFDWRGHDVSPNHTYYIPLEDSESLMRHFTRSARRSIKRNQDVGFNVVRQDVEGIKFIINTLQERYQEQGNKFRLKQEYVQCIEEVLRDDSFRTYVGYLNDEPVIGRIVLQHSECASFWKGMAIAPNRSPTVPVGDLLNWNTMTGAIEMGATELDMTWANTPRLCKYKSKFNPELREYYIIEKSSRFVGSISRLYKWLIRHSVV